MSSSMKATLTVAGDDDDTEDEFGPQQDSVSQHEV